MTATSKKLSDLLIKTDKVPLDGRKKVWIYQHGILPVLSWDFMMTEFCSTKLQRMEGQVTKYLKKWLKLTKSTDPSILYRGKFGLKISSIKDSFLTSRTNTEITLCTSKDPVVRAAAKRRRESDLLCSTMNTPKRLKTAVSDLTFQQRFCHGAREGIDSRGLGSKNGGEGIKINKKEITKRVKEISNDKNIAKITSPFNPSGLNGTT